MKIITEMQTRCTGHCGIARFTYYAGKALRIEGELNQTVLLITCFTQVHLCEEVEITLKHEALSMHQVFH